MLLPIAFLTRQDKLGLATTSLRKSQQGTHNRIMPNSLKISARAADITKITTDCIVVPFFDGCKLSPPAKILDQASGGSLKKLLKTEQAKGDKEETLLLTSPEGIRAKRVLLIGAGDVKSMDKRALKKLILAIGKVLGKVKGKQAHLCLEPLCNKEIKQEWLLRQSAQWLTHQSYSFDLYKSEKKATKTNDQIIAITFLLDKVTKVQQTAVKTGHCIANGMALARDLANTPGNDCHPSHLAAQARKLANKHRSLSCKVIDEKALEKMGAGAFCAVAKGSKQSGKLILLTYKGAKNRSEAPYVFVGKGITFDSGGISLKPGAGMQEMKFDMCGAASVLGLVQIVAELGLPINMMGVVAAAENMPSGDATRPGDIIKTLSGKTVEIINTDAEGRLVLCDTLTYVKRFKPKVVVDIATLTGACIIALGHHYSGLMTNDQGLADDLLDAGNDSADYAWQLPMTEEYTKQLDNSFADLSNVGGRAAGTITAGAFLAEFAKDFTWAHLDIAGTAWISPKNNHGATGRPVPLMANYLISEATK